MTPRKSILLVTREQFGYHVDPYVYAKELTRHFAVTYYCWDYGRPRLETPGVAVRYSSRTGNLYARNFRFIRELRELTPRFTVTLLFYFAGASLLLPGTGNLKKNIICDVRTGSVLGSKWRRMLYNSLLKAEVRAFQNRSFISEGLGRSLGFAQFNVLPLGASTTDCPARSYDRLHLIYVGTFETRNLEESIAGLGIFHHRHGGNPVGKYTIIGSGTDAEVGKLKKAIVRYGLENVVDLTGYIQRDNVGSYLSQANVGVSYVPMTDYYNFQPVTKTYEYFLAGLPVIATATHEHRLIIEPHNGVLIESNADSFAEGLDRIYRRRGEYSADEIRKRASDFSYAHIVDSSLATYLRSVIDAGEAPATGPRSPKNFMSL